MIFQTLRCLGFLPPQFSSHLPTFSSFPLLPCLSHTGSFPAHLPKLHVCSNLSRWFRAEMRKLPYPFHWLRSPPPSSGLSQKCRCLICTLQTGGGHREENPHCQFWPAPSQQGPAGLPTPHRTRSYTNQWLSIPRLYFFLLVSFSQKTSCLGGEAGQSLPWVWVMTCYPFLAGKGGTDQTCCQPLPATHCAISSDATLQAPPPPHFSF